MFNAQNMSRSARQAAKFNGLATVASYEIVNQTHIVNDEQLNEFGDIVVIRAYSPTGAKSVDITASDIYLMETEYQDAPMARVK